MASSDTSQPPKGENPAPFGAPEVAQMLIEHRATLLGYLLSCVRHHADAEDLFQDVSLAATRSAADLRNREGFLPWAREIARRRVLAHYRKSKRLTPIDPELATRLAETAAAMDEAREIPARIAALHACLDALPLESRKLVASIDADWHGETPQQNQSLPIGSYELAQGSINLQFADGANVSLGAPATFMLKSANHIHLERGNLVGQIPDEALGFIVTSPQSEVVDLGTEFGLAVSDEGQTDVHVLDGLVEVLPPSGAAPSPGVMISGGEARRFESDPSTSPRKIPVTSREGLLGANPFSDLGLQMLRGSVRVTDALSEADYTEKPSGPNWIKLVAEQRGVTTSHPLEVTLKEPGNYRDFGDISATLPPGQKLNSYLLHFRPSSKNQVRGVIRFDQPIVGILCSRKHLSETDALFGLPTVYYPDHPGARGMEPDTFPTAWDTGMMPEWQPDELIFSQDRRTICVNTYGNPERGYDQVRVITKSPTQN